MMSLEEAKTLKNWIVTRAPIYLHMPACKYYVTSCVYFLHEWQLNISMNFVSRALYFSASAI